MYIMYAIGTDVRAFRVDHKDARLAVYCVATC